ncbi:cytochrome P450 [Streptosporangium canum]|uniref:cytochrome P450 n=1 Tax=Streptosporangium canum TaxID=324952 RepID=UPI00342DC71D
MASTPCPFSFPFPDHPGLEPAAQYAELRQYTEPEQSAEPERSAEPEQYAELRRSAEQGQPTGLSRSAEPGQHAEPGRSAGQGRPPLVPVELPGGVPALLAHRHADACAVLTDPGFSREAATELRMTSRSKESLALNVVDPPVHTRRRQLLAHAFTARQAGLARPATERLAGELIGAMVRKGPPAELVADFALPLTMGVIGGILGVPAPEQRRLHPWVEAMMSTTAYSPEEIAAAHKGVHGYFAGLLDAATDGLPGELAEHVRQGTLGRDEAVHLVSGLFIAGYETTGNQLGMCVLALLRHPLLLKRLRSDPAATPQAVEELLRYTSLNAAGGVPHVALEDRPVGGTVVRAGQVVVPVTDGANRDPDVFDEPDLLDIDRPHNPHLSFGRGRHMCLGAGLARMELQVALDMLVAELPGLGLAVPEDTLGWREGMYARGLLELPVRW